MSTPVRSIRKHCLDCCCNSAHEVRLCPCTDCALYPFRLGKNPNIKRARQAREELHNQEGGQAEPPSYLPVVEQPGQSREVEA